MRDGVRLHRSHDSGGSSPSTADEAQTKNVSAPAPMPEGGATAVGATLSRYVVLEEVGRGGMGRVLRAYDPKLQREVALKEVRPGGTGREGTVRLDAEATQRLVAEARAMAKLSHPNVVAVYDVEELRQGRVILVMEYVAGQTLRQWLRKEAPPWRDVVDHFVAAGRGLVAAHEAGLLHRDFKPANVLVAHDQTVKVTDFGLAKADESSSSSLSAETGGANEALTEAGVVMGTPRYMAPEQHRGGEVGAAADQYAFCVALWEALCGAPPFSGKTMGKDKASGPPSWPAVYRSAHSLRSGAQGSTPRPIVDAILRGLSPRPAERWPTTQALLEALAWDPARKRNRWLLGVGGVGVLSLAGVSYEAWAQTRAQQCTGAEQQLHGIWDEARSDAVQTAILGIGKSYAQDVWTRTKRELDGYAGDWVTMHTEACTATAVRGEQSPQMLDLRMGCLHRAVEELRATVDTLADADAKVVHNAHKLTEGLRPLSRCADTEALAAEVEPPLPEEADAVEAARLDLARAQSLERAGRYEAAREAVEAAKDALVGVEYGPVQTEVALEQGLVLEDLGEYEASEAILSEALESAAHRQQSDAMMTAARRLMYVVGYQQRRMEEGLRYWPLLEGLFRGEPQVQALSRSDRASILRAQGKYEEAEAEQRAALSLLHKQLDPDHPDVAQLRNNLANVLVLQGKYEETGTEHRAALSTWTKALGPDHPNVAMSRNNLANVLYSQGKYQEAGLEYRAALSLWEKALGPDHPDVAGAHNNLSNVLAAQGKYAESEAESRAAVSILVKAVGPDNPKVALFRNNLGGTLFARGKHEDAEVEFRAALSLRLKVLPPEHPDIAQSRGNLGSVLYVQGKYEDAEVEYRAALAAEEKALGPEHKSVANTRNSLATTLSAQGKYDEAEAEHEMALSVRQKALDPEHPDLAESRSNLAEFLLERGRPAEAVPLAEQAWARRQGDDIPKEHRARTAFVLARILWSVEGSPRDRGRARALAEDALRSYQEASEAYAGGARKVQQWLDEHRLR